MLAYIVLVLLLAWFGVLSCGCDICRSELSAVNVITIDKLNSVFCDADLYVIILVF